MANPTVYFSYDFFSVGLTLLAFKNVALFSSLFDISFFSLLVKISYWKCKGARVTINIKAENYSLFGIRLIYKHQIKKSKAFFTAKIHFIRWHVGSASFFKVFGAWKYETALIFYLIRILCFLAWMLTGRNTVENEMSKYSCALFLISRRSWKNAYCVVTRCTASK